METGSNSPLVALRPLRLLIVRVGAMGDVLHALPAVAALKERHPEWEIGWAVEPRWRALLGLGPVVDTVFDVPTREWKRRPFSRATVASVRGLRDELRRERFAVCVDMQGSIRSAVIGRLAGAGRFVGPERPREMPARWMYGQRVRTTAMHVVEQGCELLGGAVGETLRPGAVRLPVDEAAESWAEAVVRGIAPDGEAVVMLAPTAGWRAKEWPAERYGAVARGLAAAGFRVLVNAAGEQDEVAGAVVRASGGAATLVACGVSELIALTRRMRLVIAGDTGPLHLAAALGRPVVGIYGPTDPARTGPYGTGSYEKRTRVLRDAGSVVDHRRRKEPEAGLLRISSEAVMAAAMELLGDVAAETAEGFAAEDAVSDRTGSDGVGRGGADAGREGRVAV